MCRTREEMPQIAWENYGDFLVYCQKRGVLVRHGIIHPRMLRSVQCPGEWQQHMVSYNSFKKPVLNSGDHVLLDGNTRWNTAMVQGMDSLLHYELHVTYPEALELMLKYHHSYTVAMNRAKEWEL